MGISAGSSSYTPQFDNLHRDLLHYTDYAGLLSATLERCSAIVTLAVTGPRMQRAQWSGPVV